MHAGVRRADGLEAILSPTANDDLVSHHVKGLGKGLADPRRAPGNKNRVPLHLHVLIPRRCTSKRTVIAQELRLGTKGPCQHMAGRLFSLRQILLSSSIRTSLVGFSEGARAAFLIASFKNFLGSIKSLVRGSSKCVAPPAGNRE
jgi:hypothetical protein